MPGVPWERFDDIVKKSVIARKNMEKKRLTKAKAHCPYCNGMWHMRLVDGRGGKNIHLKCDGDCKTMMMT